MIRNLITILALVSLTGAPVRTLSRPDNDVDSTGKPFIRRNGEVLHARGLPFHAAGTNNYYLLYQSKQMVDDVFARASAAGFNVLRTWGYFDIGHQDGSDSIGGKQNGVYLQSFDGTAPAYNDGDDGMKRLDYVLYKASQSKLRLIISFVNNWDEFGGMAQYVRWAGGQYHDEFYTSATIRGWYKDWISHVLNRVNSYTGVAYKDDATIMAWELANEPRCGGGKAYPVSGTCTTQTLLTWADDVSRYVKSIDKKHLVSSGDEGFFCTDSTSSDWTENCASGVDTVAFAKLPAMDLMSFHLYPDGWGKTADWGTQSIKRHITEARKIHKPAYLGEFGLLDKATRNPVYKKWTDTVLANLGAGALYWMLAGDQDNGSPYPDYDGFTVYCPSPVCTTISNFSSLFQLKGLMFPPVADDDEATVPFNTAVTLHATANDITYWGVALEPRTLDLDPATAGRQTTLTTAAGIFAAQANGDVVFTPVAGFTGKATASYVVKDAMGHLSNAAALTVNVKPDPNAAIKLYSFEDGTEGWAALNGHGTVAQTTDFATDGTHGLQIATTADGDWFGLAIAPALNLTPKTHLKWDLQTTAAAGTSVNAVVQLGDGWTWCQGPWSVWANAGTTTTADLDLTALDCGLSDVTKVQAIYLWFGGSGVFNIDNLRAE